MTLPAESTRLAEFSYNLRPVERGYANRTLYINLDANALYKKPVTRSAARGSGVDLYGSGPRSFADLPGQSGSTALLPDVAHVVQPAWSLQASVE